MLSKKIFKVYTLLITLNKILKNFLYFLTFYIKTFLLIFYFK